MWLLLFVWSRFGATLNVRLQPRRHQMLARAAVGRKPMLKCLVD
jgi:hypothetical protein